MTEEVSARIVDQRIRNRIIEAVEMLADGAEGLRHVGFVEYFESFYDWIPYGSQLHPNSALNDEERIELIDLAEFLDRACDATPSDMTAVEFIATGWPDRIQPRARQVLVIFVWRGKFDEDCEEERPSR